MSCEDMLILFCKLEFFAVFYLVRAAHKLALILLQTEYLTEMFLAGSVCYLCKLHLETRDPNPPSQG